MAGQPLARCLDLTLLSDLPSSTVNSCTVIATKAGCAILLQGKLGKLNTRESELKAQLRARQQVQAAAQEAAKPGESQQRFPATSLSQIS